MRNSLTVDHIITFPGITNEFSSLKLYMQPSDSDVHIQQLTKCTSKQEISIYKLQRYCVTQCPWTSRHIFCHWTEITTAYIDQIVNYFVLWEISLNGKNFNDETVLVSVFCR